MAQFNYEPEWRSKTVLERLAHSYSRGLFVDKFFLSFLGRKYPVKAHKNFLAHVSKVFEEHFYGDEKHSHLTDIHPLGLSCVLRLLYKLPSSFEHGDRSVILFAYHAARTLRILHIENKIKDEILEHTIEKSFLTSEEFWKFFELSRVLKLKDVTEALLEFASINTNEILNASSLEIASASTVKQVLDLDNLNVSEIDVLASSVRWYYANYSEPFARDFLKDLLSCVRFRNVSVKDFVTFMKSHWGIMEGKDVMMISMHLERPMFYSLPSWCSANFRLPSSSTVLSHLKEQRDKKSLEICSDDFQDTQEDDPIRFSDMFIQEKFTDVCFVVGPQDSSSWLVNTVVGPQDPLGKTQQRRVRAHRNILALGSPVFEKMFFGPLADSRCEIEIHTDYPDGFETMIKFFYDDSHPDDLFKRPDIASMAFDVALKYGSEKLRTLCSGYKEPETLKLATFWKHLEYRIQLGSEGENESILEQFPRFAESNTADIFKHFSFMTAAREAIIFVLKLDSLQIKEIKILEHISQWIEHHFLCSSQDIKYELLGHIRFKDISASEFLSFLKTYPDIFSNDETLQIILYVNDNSCRLPDWCYQGPSRRSIKSSLAKSIKKERDKLTNVSFNETLKQPKSVSFKFPVSSPGR